ncbi:UNVERIFIED_ORG: hypothetical protein CLV66_11166 [Actinomadura viridilutea]|uniref:hypothetical protein n=1 Tax=Actinomadura rubrobrunea TaxID=115335 RepID=UPI0008337BE6|nr:hypothetical protein [Actinomadura rubrobrunea]
MSGSHRSGSHRAGSGSHRRVGRDRRPGRRLAVLLTGVVAGAAVCVLAAFAILGGLEAGREGESGEVVGSGAADSSAPSTPRVRTTVPDACEVLSQDIADRLAPGAERNPADNYQASDQQSQCVWGAYSGDRKRQLTVELRAIVNGQGGPVEAARRAFADERSADESGKALLAGQELTDKRDVEDVGDEGYVVYSVDKRQGSGEAIANVRLDNILVTVHYSGGDDGDALSASDAMDGAEKAVKGAVDGLDAG